MQQNDRVILVDENDKATGTEEKLKAHELGLLHRAISVFVFNSNGKMLLQKRAGHKYHSGGLWTNTCCSHPAPGEETIDAAKRRLKEEMGISVNELQFAFSFIYKVELDNSLTEHELDHVFLAVSDHEPVLNTDEASAFEYQDLNTIREKIKLHPEQFTFWFKHIFERIIDTAIQKQIIR